MDRTRYSALTKLWPLVALSAALTGCATAPEAIKADAVSASVYDPYDCNQIRAELVRVQGKLQTVIDMQGKQSNRDVLLTSALILSPAFTTIMLLASKDLKKEVAALKGEFVALNEAATLRKCGV